MTQPTYRPPGFPFEATSRFRGSRFYTPPDPVIIAAFLTIVAKFQKKYDIAIMAFCVMGSHDHLLPIDRDRNRPSRVSIFRQQVHACMGKFLQYYWDLPDDPVYCRKVAAQLFPILDHERLIEKISYIENNFIAAGLVASNDELPVGTVSTREMMREPITVARPDVWFSPRTWPDEVEIKLEVPDWYLEKEGISLETFEKQAAEQCAADAEAHNRAREERGESVKGLAALQAETPYEEQKDEVSRDVVLFTGNDRTKNAKFYLDWRRFLRSYRRAMENVRKGKHDVLFPCGTNKMAVSYGFAMYVPPG